MLNYDDFSFTMGISFYSTVIYWRDEVKYLYLIKFRFHRVVCLFIV